VGRVVALIVAVSQAGYAFAPAAFGLIREFAATSASTEGPALFIVAAVIQGLAIVAYMIGRRR
jgi:hypothetical protein